MQLCFESSCGLAGLPCLAKYAGEATVTTRVLSRSLDDMVDGGCSPNRMATSTPEAIRLPASGSCKIVKSSDGYCFMNRPRLGPTMCRENMTLRLTRNEPFTAEDAVDVAVAASSSPARCGRAVSYNRAPSVV